MSTATIECGSTDRHAGDWTASLRLLRTGWILEWETRPEYGIAGEDPCTFTLIPRVYSLSQGLPKLTLPSDTLEV